MTLIKCSECGKKISDKAKSCIHCGCPINKNSNKNKLISNFPKIWLILCVIASFTIFLINIFDVLHTKNQSISISAFYINVMGILSFALGVSYILLLKTYSKKYFYFLLGINAIILVYNILKINLVISVFYILCVVINVVFTFVFVRKILKKTEFSFKKFLPIIIVLLLLAIIPFIFQYYFNYINSSSYRSNVRNSNLNQIEIIADYINIRSDKNVSSYILGKVYAGDIYTVLSEDETSRFHWFEIETRDGIHGFIAGKNGATEYVKILENDKTIPKEETESEEIKEEKQEKTKETTTKKTNTSSTKKKEETKSTKKNVNEKNENGDIKPINEEVVKETDNKQVIEEKKSDKKIINATISYSCPSDAYTYNRTEKTCSIETYSSQAKELVCPSGYEPYDILTKKCKGITPAKTIVDATSYMTCSTGDQHYVVIDGVEMCRSGNLTKRYTCPSGYELTSLTISGITSYSCSWKQKGTTTGSIRCNDGYTYDKYNNICYKVKTVDATKNYSCPSGYELKDDKCYEK